MVLAMGRGHNASNVVQTLGRATFNGRNVLNENGFDKVTVLMTSNDLTMCVKIQNYINHIADRVQQGDSLAAAMTGTNEEIPDTANWIRHTFRELGRVKGTILILLSAMHIISRVSHLLLCTKQASKRCSKKLLNFAM